MPQPNLRVSAGAVLVVPPFECAWLADEELQLRGGSGCVSFEVRGANDATVLFKATPGSKRWHHASSSANGTSSARDYSSSTSTLPKNPELNSTSSSNPPSSSEPSYTVILGSHRNSCLKFERDGVTVASARHGPGARLPASGAGFFLRVWVNVDCARGLIAVGAGSPGSTPFTCWRDPAPWPREQAARLRHVGLSAWDAALAYRSIRVSEALDLDLGDGGFGGGGATLLRPPPPLSLEQRPPPPPALPLELPLSPPPAAVLLPELFSSGRGGGGAGAGGQAAAGHSSSSSSSSASSVPRLSELAAAASAAHPVPGRAAAALAEVCRLSPALDALRPALAAALASGCPRAAETDRRSLRELPLSEIEALLADPRLACPEERVLGIVLSWARAEREAFCPSREEKEEDEDGAFAAVAAACLGRRKRGEEDAEEEEDEGEEEEEQEQFPRLADLDRLLPLVRFPLMRPATLAALRRSRLAALSQELLPLLDEADTAQRQHQQRPLPAKAAKVAREQPPPPPQQQQRQAGGNGGPLSLALGVTGARGVTASPAARAAASLPPGAPRRAALAAARSAPRPPRGGVDLLFMAAGDGGGALQWLATAGGTRPRLNPAACGAVAVRCSSPACRGTTDPRALVSGCVAACNRAGPPQRISGEGSEKSKGDISSSSSSFFAGGWWEVDLSPSNAALALDYYTLQADGSGDWPRNWVLLGSDGDPSNSSSSSLPPKNGSVGGGENGGKDDQKQSQSPPPQQPQQRWTVLRRHVDDATLNHAGCYGSWAVTGAAAARAWRAFRVVATGPHAGPGAPPGALALSGVEFYGSLFVGEAFEVLRGGEDA